MSSDTLTVPSRNFFERTRAKLVISIATGAMGLMLLGFGSSSGGLAESSKDLNKHLNDDHISNSYSNLAAGYGE